MKNRFKAVFEADSVIKTLVLCVLTFGAFLIYKLYCFSDQINQKSAYTISNIFIAITILLFVMAFGSLIYGLAHFNDPDMLRNSIGIHVLSSVFDVTWIIMVRHRINLIAGANKGDKLWLAPFVTSIFHVIYMQHKINQGLSEYDYSRTDVK